MQTGAEDKGIALMEHIQAAIQKSRSGPGDTIGPALRAPRDAVWAGLPTVRTDPTRLEAKRIVTASGLQQASGAFDMLRTRVLNLLRQNNWTSIAVTSPAPGGGKSVVALNLAYSITNRTDCRAVLMDLDLRRPQIADALGIHNPPAIADYLTGKAGMEHSFRLLRTNLAVALNGRSVRLASELLQSPEAAKAFREMKHKLMPDVVICDLPPMLAADDVIAFLPNVDCAILVAEADSDTLEQVDACEFELAHQTKLLGVVLNKCLHGAETIYRNGR